ncbi:MAG: hypothetical protein EOP83_28865 [Verrucomicrobiaceae bacterium]|nr:MAG: hypothetical protein EOP83_28865 [Verrucomicrobiaceae bacterium]
MKSSPQTRTAGWSLVELLIVVAIMGFVAATMAGAMHGLAGRHRAKEAAIEFQSLVREASALAKREMMPVRLAFILPDSKDALKTAGIEDADIAMGCRMLLFKVPGRYLPVQSLQSPVEGIVPELPIARMPRFSPMTGGWTAVPNRRAWLSWKDVKIDGDLAEMYAQQGFAPVAKKFQYQPETVWAEEEGTDKDPFSVYAVDFSLSPYRDLRSIVTAALPGDERVSLEGIGSISADDLFGGQELPHWSKRTGESKADRVELPTIDFMPDGSLACHDDEKKELAFRFGDEGKESSWTVKVRIADAEAWVE